MQQDKKPLTEKEMQQQLFEEPSLQKKEEKRVTSPGFSRKPNTKQEQDIDEETFQELVKKNREKQDKITEDMVTTVRTLKENNMHMHKVITEGNQVEFLLFLLQLTLLLKQLETLDKSVSDNKSKLDTENEKLRNYSTTSCSSTLTYWIMLVFVVILFVVMYLFMKLIPKPIPS